jgi:hypothetical protein
LKSLTFSGAFLLENRFKEIPLHFVKNSYLYLWLYNKEIKTNGFDRSRDSIVGFDLSKLNKKI